MKAEVITVPKEVDSVVVLFNTGLVWDGQDIYLESTGNNLRDMHNKEDMNLTVKGNKIDQGTL